MSIQELESLAKYYRFYVLGIPVITGLWAVLAAILTFSFNVKLNAVNQKINVLRQADLQATLSSTQTELAAVNAKAIELQQQVAPRALTEAQKNKFIAALLVYPRGHYPKGPISVLALGNSSEQSQFISQIEWLLHDAGFEPVHSGIAMMLDQTDVQTPPPWCIGILLNQEIDSGATAPLQNAFQEIGINPFIINQKKRPAHTTIYVGVR